MCGIFGLITKPGQSYAAKSTRQTVENIAILSESRGKDSSGMAIRQHAAGKIDIIKGDLPIRALLKSSSFQNAITESLEYQDKGKGFCAFGHARLVTNGTQLNEVNNQPVLKDEVIIIHNGIIVNVEELWRQHTDLDRTYSIDTEIIPALIRKHFKSTNDLAEACNNTFAQLEGTWSVAIMFHDLDQFVLATNNGSLYYITDNENFITFASEGYFLERLKQTDEFASFGSSLEVRQLISNKGLVVNMSELKISFFESPVNSIAIPVSKVKPLELKKHLLDNEINKREVVIDPAMFINRSKEAHLFSLLENNTRVISKLRRCTKCLLPETFPFIQYDHEGVCNYCNNYEKKNQPKSLDELMHLVEPYRRTNGKPDS